MNPFTIALISAAGILGGALCGIRLQRLLPGHHLSKEMQELVKLSAGIVATLTALVLGLLVSSAKGTFDTVNTGIVQGAAKYIMLDRTLARYGPETQAVREQLKHTLEAGIEMVWPTQKSGNPVLPAFERANGMEQVLVKLDGLTPQNDSQREIFAQAQELAADLSQTRWLLLEEAHTQLPTPLLVILVFWLVLLFMSFGLFSPRNLTALVVLSVGACAISLAIFLVLELNQPLDGFIKVSGAPMRNALQHLGQ